MKALQTHYSLFHYIGHTALKRFKDIVTITVVIVFLTVIAMISLCMIATLCMMQLVSMFCSLSFEVADE